MHNPFGSGTVRSARPDDSSSFAQSWPLPLAIPFTIGFLESAEITSHGGWALLTFGLTCWMATYYIGYRLMVWHLMARPGAVVFARPAQRDKARQVYHALSQSDYAGLADETWEALAAASLSLPGWFNPLSETAMRAAGKRASMVSKTVQIETLMALLKDAHKTSAQNPSD